jgi:glycosyltransferase involved in cell wall biosynthesis
MTPPQAAGSPRIAYLTKVDLLSDDAAAAQIVQTASALVQAGAALDLFCPVRPGASLTTAELRERYRAECGFALRPLPTASSNPRLTHLRHAVAAARAARDKYDLIHTRDVENVLLGLRNGNRVLFETYRTPDGRNPLVRKLLRRAFDDPRFLGQLCHSRYALERHLTAGYPAEKLCLAYNGVALKEFLPERTPAEARALLGLPERTTVVYAGRISPVKRIDLLLDAAAETPELAWVLAGRSDSAEAAPLVARGSGLPNVRFLGFLPGPALVPALQAADVLVIPPSADPLERHGTTVLPIKLFQYLAAARPLVVGDVADTAELLRQDETCLRVPPGDRGAFVAALRTLATDPARRGRLGADARRLAAGLSWEARARTILGFVRERLAAQGQR